MIKPSETLRIGLGRCEMVLAYLYVETEQDREEALRVRAREVLTEHSGVLGTLLALTPERQRELDDMDPGPCVEVGIPPK